MINVISPLDAMQVDELRKKFQAETGKGLIQVLEKETGSYFWYVSDASFSFRLKS